MQTDQLARRREELIARCEEQRKLLTWHSTQWTSSMSAMDASVVLLRRVKEHPAWIGGIAVLLIALNPRRAQALLKASTIALKTWRTVAPVVHSLQQRR
ncbi:MAG TPA: YqjK family protein [Paucimonas sp.]|nr:YqjK family protein [Paucimonas sp.]HJW55134.1 YqjK family protein [Burkholderiaceae bacterium]